MHFGHPRSITTFKNRNFLKIWIFQSFPHTRLGHFGLIFGLRILKSLQKMAREWWKNEKIQKFFKNIRNFLQLLFEIPEPTMKHHKLRFSKISWILTPKIGYFEAFLAEIYPSRIFTCLNPWEKFSKKLPKNFFW